MRGSDHVPEGWKRQPLRQIAEINIESLGADTPTDLKFDYIDIASVEKGIVRWGKVGEQVYRSAPSRARRVVRDGDVLFGTVRPALKSHGYVPETNGRTLIASTGFAVIRAIAGLSSPPFLFHTILAEHVAEQARRMEVGSNYPAVNESDVARFSLMAPPLPEQRRIAEILDTIDEAIRKTEQVIEKLKAMKQGLLHDLLTRGIDDNGELRPPPTEAPHLYQDSPLGMIPRGWEVERLVDVAEVRSGIAKNTGKRVSSPVLVHYLRVANVQDGYLDLSEMSQLLVSREDIDRYSVRPGDVLMNEGGDLDKLGRGAIWRGEYEPCVHQNHVFVVRCGQRLSGDFLDIWTGSPSARRYFMVAGKQTTNLASINKTALGQLPVVLPSVVEQSAILNLLHTADEACTTEAETVGKLRTLKRGLMDDLLTGRVRVQEDSVLFSK